MQEKISEIISQQSSTTQVSTDDALGAILGKEHSGRECGVGFGPCPSMVFGRNYTHFDGANALFGGSASSNSYMDNRMQALEDIVKQQQEMLETQRQMIQDLMRSISTTNLPCLICLI